MVTIVMPITELAPNSPILISNLLKDCLFWHNGWIRDNTVFKGFYRGKKLKVLINKHLSLSRDEIMMGLRHKRKFSEFGESSILKITVDDVDIRAFTEQQLTNLIDGNRHLALSDNLPSRGKPKVPFYDGLDLEGILYDETTNEQQQAIIEPNINQPIRDLNMNTSVSVEGFLNSDAFLKSTMNSNTVQAIVAQFGGGNGFISKFVPVMLSAEIKMTPTFEDGWDTQAFYSKNKENINLVVGNKTNLANGEDFLQYIKSKCATATLDEVARGLSDPTVNHQSKPALLEAGRYMANETCSVLASNFIAYHNRAKTIYNLSVMLEKPIHISGFITGYAMGYNTIMSSALAQALAEFVGGYKELLYYSELMADDADDNSCQFEELNEVATDAFYKENKELVLTFVTDLAKNDYDLDILDFINKEYYNMERDADSISHALYADYDNSVKSDDNSDSITRLFIVEECLLKLCETIGMNFDKYVR